MIDAPKIDMAAISQELQAYTQVMEDIQHRDLLLNTVNQAAAMLLESDGEESIESVIMKSMELIGRSIAVDRVQIWRNETIDDELSFVHTYEWLSQVGAQQPPVPIGLHFPYSSKPTWLELFMAGGYINAPYSELSADDQAFLKNYGIKSIVIIPLFLQDEFWGFFSVDDCEIERSFNEDEISILHSASLMMASALLRDEILTDIRTTAGRLDAIISNYRGVVWSANRKGRINQISGLFLKESGIEPEQIIGMDIEMLQRSYGIPDLLLRYQAVLRSKQPSTSVSAINGRSFQAHIVPLFDRYGQVSGVVGSFDDISEMVALQEKLKQENIEALEQFEMIWDKVESGMIIIDAQRREIVDANPATVRIFGAAKRDIVGRRCFDFFGEHQCPIIDLHQTMDRQERQFTLADGRTIPVLKSVANITFNGRPALLESFTDISYMKEAEEQAHMLELSERVQLMLDANPHVNILFNDDNEILDGNQAAVDYMGFNSKEEMLAGFAQRLDDAVQAAVAMGFDTKPTSYWFPIAFREGFVSFESELVFDGEQRSVYVELKRIPYKQSFAIVGYIIDMTETYRRERELRQAREDNELQLAKLNTAVQATKIGLWDMEVLSTDPTDPNNDFYWTQELRQMLGFRDESDFPNKLGSWSSRLHPEDKDWVLAAFKEFCLDKTGQTPYDIEYRLMVKGGEYRYFRATGKSILDYEGDYIRVAGSMMDITETKNILLDTERQRIEAEAANKAKSEFLSTMSHEIRTPINAILGITEIQLQDDTLSRELKDALGRIYISGDMLLGIINDVLDLSRIEAGKLVLAIDKYEIPSLISDTAQLNMMRIGSKPIEFELQLDERTPMYVCGDELRVKQILNNVLSNAFKYTDSGKVVLKVGFLEDKDGGVAGGAGVAGDGGEAGGGEFKGEVGDDKVVLSFAISDTGQGMSPEQVARIFEEYSRFNTDANRSTEGTGLGMSITQNLLRLMGGELTIESELGVGSTFTIYLPQLRSGDEVLGHELTENLHQFRSYSRSQMKRTQVTRDPMPYGSVLVVDDVETNNYVTKGLLAPYKLQVQTVNSGYVAIELVKQGKDFDIIFMDHMMPGMDGIEATQIIRELGYERPIVALTANAVVGQAEMFLDNGFDDFVSKPIDVRQLNNVLNKWIRDKYPLEVVEAARREAEAAGAEAGDVDGTGVGGTGAAVSQHPELLPDSKAIWPAGRQWLDPQVASAFLHDSKNSLTHIKAVLDKALVESKPLDEDDIRVYVIYTHGIKGALANIGNRRLSEIALSLENAGRDKDIAFMVDKTPAFLESLQTFMDNIQTRPASTLTSDLHENNQLLTDQLTAIKVACASYDEQKAEETLDAMLKDRWPEATMDLLYSISEQLLHSSFDEVIASVDEFLGNAT